jgi:hypothetical protein
MSANRRVETLLSLPIAALFCLSAPGLSAEDAKDAKAALPSAQEVHSKRTSVRESVTIPSLDGIRGFAYRTVGFADTERADKKLGTKFEQIGLPLFSSGELKEGSEPVDALVQVSFVPLGKYAVTELTVTQWVSLLRSPKTKVRAVTYRNRVFAQTAVGDNAVTELANQFVIDFLKANKKPSSATQKKAAAGSKSKDVKTNAGEKKFD